MQTLSAMTKPCQIMFLLEVHHFKAKVDRHEVDRHELASKIYRKYLSVVKGEDESKAFSLSSIIPAHVSAAVEQKLQYKDECTPLLFDSAGGAFDC